MTFAQKQRFWLEQFSSCGAKHISPGIECRGKVPGQRPLGKVQEEEVFPTIFQKGYLDKNARYNKKNSYKSVLLLVRNC